MAERYVIEEVVDDGDECPDCAEARVDTLVWLDDYIRVECQRCGSIYEPRQG